MDETTYLSFLDVWHNAVRVLALTFFVLGVLTYVFYKLAYLFKKGNKQKYDYASANEIKYLLLTHYFVAAGVFFILNFLRAETVEISIVWFLIRLFTSICLATLHAYVAFLVFKYYYPKPLSKKLKKLRYTPRINPETGTVLKLLSEEEEDAYLDEGMQAEEDVFSVDYDVWVDPLTDYVKIEKYKGHLAAQECDRCGFQTLKLVKEEVTKQPSETSDGEIRKEYRCTYCNRIKRQTVRLSRNTEPSLEHREEMHLIDDPIHDTTVAVSVKIEVLSNKGDIKNYEFQNTEEASKFLHEFDFSKVETEGDN